MELEGKRVVVTGAGQGLGRAYAEGIAREGASVIVNDVDAERAREVVEGIRQEGGNAEASVASVADWDDAAGIIATCVEAFGGIDGLVNNAGLHTVNNFTDEDPNFTRRMVEVNVLGAIYTSLATARQIEAQKSGGVIVNVTSGAASGLAQMATYGATKGAVAGLTWNLAVDLKELGIRVNAISPAAATSMVENTRRVRPSVVTWGPELMAPLVVFLLSDLSKSITGQIVKLWGTELQLVRHHGPIAPAVTRDVWTPAEFAKAFETELVDQLQPYQRDMEGFVPFASGT
jgi:NAD(P)-dependent dehydrogenase (short-subunit alcohol dehydrogenase family)